MVFVAAIVDFDRVDDLGVAAVERLGEAKNGGERTDDPPFFGAEAPKSGRILARRTLPVVSRDERDDLGLERLESAEIAVLDQVIRMLVVPRIADVRADVVKNGPEFEPFTFAVRQLVNGPRLIEHGQCKPRHLIRVLGPITAPLGQLDYAAAPDIRILTGLCDVFAIALDVVEHQSFAKREITQHNLGRLQMLEHHVEHHRTGNDEIGAARIETRQLHALAEASCRQLLAEPADLLGRHPEVPDLISGASAFSDRDGAEAQNRARRPDDTIETGGPDTLEVLGDFVFHMADELAFVAA